MKNTLLSITIIAGIMGAALMNGLAFGGPENIALKDYKIGKGEIANDVSISDLSIPIYQMVTSDRILVYKGTKVSELIENTKETLWFIMNKNQPEGILVVTSDVPVKMGGENRSKDLMEIYMSAKSSLQQGDELRYFEMDGQGIFLVMRSNSEEVYLSHSASQLLNMPANQKVDSQDFIAGIKAYGVDVNFQRYETD